MVLRAERIIQELNLSEAQGPGTGVNDHRYRRHAGLDQATAGQTDAEEESSR
jgi:hypothetical protein